MDREKEWTKYSKSNPGAASGSLGSQRSVGQFWAPGLAVPTAPFQGIMTAMPYMWKWSWGLEDCRVCCYRLSSLGRQSANGYCTLDNSSNDLHWAGEKLTLRADALRLLSQDWEVNAVPCPARTGLKLCTSSSQDSSSPHGRFSSGQRAPWLLESVRSFSRAVWERNENFHESENLKTNHELSLCSLVAWTHWWHVAIAIRIPFARELLCSEWWKASCLHG